MKKIIILLLFLSIYNLNAQEKDFSYEFLGKLTCDCISNSNQEISKVLISNCLNNILEEHNDVVDSLSVKIKEIDNLPDTWIEERVKGEVMISISKNCNKVRIFTQEKLIEPKLNELAKKISDEMCEIIEDKGIEKNIDINTLMLVFNEPYNKYKYEVLALLDSKDKSGIQKFVNQVIEKLEDNCEAY